MVFPFTLKGFPHKYGVFHFCIYFLLWVLFTYMVTIHIYDTFLIWVLFTYMIAIHPMSTNTTRE